MAGVAAISASPVAMAVNICVFINISCRPEIRQCLCRPRNADGADPFRPLPERRLHRAERAGSEPFIMAARSEEHTSELQSLMRISYAVFCLKKKNKKNKQYNTA